MGLTSRQLDNIQKGAVRVLIGFGLVGIGLTIYTVISISRFKNSEMMAQASASSAPTSAPSSQKNDHEDLTSE